MLPWTNASLHQPPLYARRKPPARSAVVPLEEARSSTLGWEARAKARRIVTSSSSVRVGAAVPPKSGCLRYWKACGRVSQLRCMSLKKNLAALIDQSLTVAVRICGPRVPRLTISTERTGTPWEFGGNGLRTRTRTSSSTEHAPRTVPGSRQMTGFP
jgi:hypothetical protein